MSWNSASFINTINTWFSSLSDKSETETAQTIAQAYTLSAISVNTSFAATPISLKPSLIIQQGFLQSFNLANMLSEGETDTNIWLPTATSLIEFWTNTSFNIVPPPPGGLVGASNAITSPGLPLAIALDLKTAFSQEDSISAATKLNQAFINHLSTINGTWIGTAPGAPPPPFSFPWVGLS